MARKSVDLKTAFPDKWNALTIGKHTLQVRAKNPGNYLDSDLSTAVDFYKTVPITVTATNCTAAANNPTEFPNVGGDNVLTFNKKDGYTLPETITVTGVATDGYTWVVADNGLTATLTITAATGNVTVTVTGALETYAITMNLTHASKASGPSTIAYGTTATLKFNFDTYYEAPDQSAITVTGADFTWDKATATMGLSNATGPVTITIAGVLITYAITENLTNVVKSGTHPTVIAAGQTLVLNYAASSGYNLPDTVTVTGATIDWKQATGLLTLSNATGPVTITIAGVLPKLATPANVTVDGTTVSWDEVANATSYDVLANGTTVLGTVTGGPIIKQIPITKSGNYSQISGLKKDKQYTVFYRKENGDIEQVSHILYQDNKWTSTTTSGKITEQSEDSVTFYWDIAAGVAFIGWSSGAAFEADTVLAKEDIPPETIFTETLAYWKCLVEGTLIRMADGTDKPVEDIRYGDEVKCYDFTTGTKTSTPVDWMIPEQVATKYWEITFSDGSTINLVGSNGKSHRIYNLTKQRFDYPQDFEPSDTTIKDDGTIVTIVSCKEIEKTVRYYNIATKDHINVYANGFLTSNRLNNRYKIVDNKFTNEQLMSDEEIAAYKKHLERIRLK